MHVIIIGAGTGGCAWRKRSSGRASASACTSATGPRIDGLFGYRVGISPDGSRALQACLPAELYETFCATAAITPTYFNMLTEQMHELLSLADVGGGTGAADQERSVSRMTLRQVLLTGIEDVVAFDKKFTRYEHQDDGTVTAFFEDGSSASADVLVGADGTGSPVRRQYLPHARLRESGLFAVTGKLPLTDETRALLPPKVLRGVTLINAPRGDGTIIHVMEFPWDHDGTVKSGIGGNDTALLSAWPGLNFDNTRDYIMLGFSSHGRYLPADFMRLDGPALHELLIERTARWVRRSARCTSSPIPAPASRSTSARRYRWLRGRRAPSP